MEARRHEEEFGVAGFMRERETMKWPENVMKFRIPKMLMRIVFKCCVGLEMLKLSIIYSPQIPPHPENQYSMFSFPDVLFRCFVFIFFYFQPVAHLLFQAVEKVL